MKPPHRNSHHLGDTWLEPEELCYQNWAMYRRCRAIHADTGKLVTVRCGSPDNFFSIPAQGGGWIGIDDDRFVYHPRKAT